MSAFALGISGYAALRITKSVIERQETPSSNKNLRCLLTIEMRRNFLSSHRFQLLSRQSVSLALDDDYGWKMEKSHLLRLSCLASFFHRCQQVALADLASWCQQLADTIIAVFLQPFTNTVQTDINIGLSFSQARRHHTANVRGSAVYSLLCREDLHGANKPEAQPGSGKILQFSTVTSVAGRMRHIV